MSGSYRFSSALPAIFLYVVMIFFAVFPRLLLAPLLLRIAADLGISFDRASTFFLSVSVGFSSGLIASGFIASRISHRTTIITGAVLTGLSLLALSLTHLLPLFHLLLVALGFSNGLYHGSGISSVTAIVPDGYRVRALAFHETGPNLAFILAPLLGALLAPIVGWRGVFALVGIASLGAAAAFATNAVHDTGRGEPPHFSNLRLFAGNTAYWILLYLIVVAVALAVGVFSILPTYLEVEHGLGERFLNTLIGASRIAGFVAILGAGHLADRIGYRVVLCGILFFTGALTVLIGLLEGPPLLVAVFLQPMVTQSFFPVALGAITRIARPSARNLAISLAIPLSNIIGSGLTPALMGRAGAAGWFNPGFILLGSTAILSLPLLTALPAAMGEGGREYREPG